MAQSLAIASSAFPDEALRWRFEGYVLTDFAIAPNGGVKDVRVTLSYPPFVFDQATIKGVDGFRYIPPRLGGQVLGCEGQTQAVQFSIGQ